MKKETIYEKLDVLQKLVGEISSVINDIKKTELNKDEKDERYAEAIKTVKEHGSASASLLQRRLGIGFNKASNYLSKMEKEGIVGPAQGSKPRKVLKI